MKASQRYRLVAKIGLGIAGLYFVCVAYAVVTGPTDGNSWVDLIGGMVCFTLAFMLIWGLSMRVVLWFFHQPVQKRIAQYKQTMLGAAEGIVRELVGGQPHMTFEADEGVSYVWSCTHAIVMDVFEDVVAHFPAHEITGVEMSYRQVSSHTEGKVDLNTTTASTAVISGVLSQSNSGWGRIGARALGVSRGRTKGKTEENTSHVYHHTIDVYSSNASVPHLALTFEENEQEAKSFYGRLRSVLNMS